MCVFRLISLLGIQLEASICLAWPENTTLFYNCCFHRIS